MSHHVTEHHTAAPAAARHLPFEARPAPERGGLAPWQIRRVRMLVREHFATGLAVETAAREVRRSASYFCRAFRVSFGCTFHQFVIRARLQTACQLMLTTEDRLPEIAVASGMADQAHLCRLFKREFGDSPAAWRRRHAGSHPPHVLP